MNSTRRKFFKSMAAGSGAVIGYPLAFNGAACAVAGDRVFESAPVCNVTEFGAMGDGRADDTRPIRDALVYARDHGIGTVYVPAGVYNITGVLVIYQNTTLKLAKNARIARNSDMDAMLVNGTETVNGYEGQGNITVEGGIWDARAARFPSNVTPLGFGHARNITIRDLTVRDVFNWHHVEINAIDGATIQDCHFEGMTLTRSSTEMVQIDLMGSPGMFPWFGESDETTCRNVLINRCTFQNGNTAGIGTHSTREGARHEYITIANCEFINLGKEGIVAQNWQDVTIANNLFDRCGQGIFMEAKTATSGSNISIANNTLRSINSNGIHMRSIESGPEISHIEIDGNFISGAGGHGIVLEYCDHGLISHNTVKGCARAGIWSYFCHNIHIRSNTCFSNSLENNTVQKDISINSPGANDPTDFHIIGSNNVETCGIFATVSCILSGNIIKRELIIGPDNKKITDSHNSINRVP
ncbi:MAG: glycosyl hydrolase family 28-related protein [Balneolales bacterium]